MNEVLSHIKQCGQGKYTIQKNHCANFKKDELNALIKANSDCYPEYTDPNYNGCDGDINFYLMYHKNVLVGYIDYEIIKFDSKPILYLKFLCNDETFRGKNISVLLQCLVIAEAIQAKCHMIVVQTNATSGGILEGKFGFTLFEPSDDFYETALGQISMGIQREFNCYYNLTTPESIDRLRKRISTVIENCKLQPAKTKTTKRRKRKSSTSRKVKSSSRKINYKTTSTTK